MPTRAGDRETLELAEWALPVQQRHYEQVKEGSLRLAEAEDPNAPE